MTASARRHLQAAEMLLTGHRKDVAGYLFGIAAECAIKAMMIDAGFRPQGERRDDPFFMHFPYLRTALLENLEGRRCVPLSSFVKNESFLNNWSTDMRYCKGDEVLDRWIETWAEQSRQAVSSIGT